MNSQISQASTYIEYGDNREETFVYRPGMTVINIIDDDSTVNIQNGANFSGSQDQTINMMNNIWLQYRQ
ncbi:hypothetical protein pb186bvf_000824 [Paramecium bursaria]